MTMRHSGTTHRRAAWAATMLALVGTAISLDAVKVKSAADPKFDFSQLKTWDWNPSAPGSVKVVMTVLAESQKSEPVQRKWEPVIMKAVEDQLAAQGYKRSSGYAPDFFVTYYVLVTLGDSSQYMGQFLPTNAQWGIPLWAPATNALQVYPQGTMAIDVASKRVEDVVWRGMAEAKIEYETNEAKRTTRIQGIVKDLLTKLPKKKK